MSEPVIGGVVPGNQRFFLKKLGLKEGGHWNIYKESEDPNKKLKVFKFIVKEDLQS